MTAGLDQQRLPAFPAEIRAAIRYEKGLLAKAVVILAVLAILVILRTLYFA